MKFIPCDEKLIFQQPLLQSSVIVSSLHMILQKSF